VSAAVTVRNSPAMPEQLEQVLIGGDLNKLAPKDRVFYYRSVCESVGLNPLTRPFDYLTLNGKLTLYARKDCTDQLRNIHNISINIAARELVDGIYVVTARATNKDGRSDESIGGVPVDHLKGEAKANGMMKAETKAKRRVTLSICGLGMLDETEVDSIPDARRVQDIDTGGHPVGTQAAANHVRDQKLAEIRKEQDKTNNTISGGVQQSPVAPEVIDGHEIRTQAGTPVKSTTPPPAGQSDTGSEFLGKDEEWQQICRQCAKPETRTQMFDTFHRILQERKPSEADSIYYGVLEQYGAKNAKDIKLLSHARQASRKLYDIVVPLLKGQA